MAVKNLSLTTKTLWEKAYIKGGKGTMYPIVLANSREGQTASFDALKEQNVASDISFVTRFPRERSTVFPQLVRTIVQSLKDFPGIFHLGITYTTHSVLNLASLSPRVDNLFNLIVIFLILIHVLWLCSISEWL